MRALRALAFGLLAAFLGGVGTAGAISVTTVALSGQPAPGAPSGAVFTSFLFNSEDPGPLAHVNDTGQIRFQASLGASPSGWGIWGFDPASGVSLLARVGDPVPGFPSGHTWLLGSAPTRVPLANDGSSAFLAGVLEAGVGSTSGVATAPFGGAATPLLLIGDPAPDIPGLQVSYLTTSDAASPSMPTASAAGETWLTGVLAGPGVNSVNSEAIWGPDGAGGLALALRSGLLLPGRVVRSFPVVVARSGCFAFQGILDGPPPTQQSSLWRHDEGAGLTMLGQQGHPAPGFGAGVTLGSHLGSLEMNEACRALLTTKVQGAGIGPTNEYVLYVSDGPGLLTPLVRQGDPAPGTSPGITLGFPSVTAGERAMNAAGAVAFRSNLIGSGVSGDTAIYVADGTDIERVARKGDAVANMANTTIQALNHDPMIDDAGHVLFFASLYESVLARYHDAVILAAPNGRLYEVAAENQSFEVAPGDSREMAFLHGSVRARGVSPVLGGAGDLLFHATFADGSTALLTLDVDDFIAEQPDCIDGLDNDGDGLVDAPSDPGCHMEGSALENPRCDDDLDNDGDGKIDWDGGSGAAPPDPPCVGQPWRDRESPSGCGLGAELAIALWLVGVLRRRAAKSRNQL